MSFSCTFVVAHRSHAQVLADGEVAVDGYPHLDLGLVDFDALTALHTAVTPAVSENEARGVYDDVEAEGVEPGHAAYILPDNVTQTVASLDIAGMRLIAEKAAMSEQVVAGIVRLGEEATKSGRDLLVLKR